MRKPVSLFQFKKGLSQGIAWVLICVFAQNSFAANLEKQETARAILPQTNTEVVIIENKKNAKPLVCIKGKDAPLRSYLNSLSKELKRPDYRLLDYRMKPGAIPYEGPVSDRTKIYIFAATIATLGVVGGAVVGAVAASAPAAGGAASGGAGLIAAGTAVSAGTVSIALKESSPNPKDDSYTHESKAEISRNKISSAKKS